MRFTWTATNSRLARRMVLLFVLAALVPMLLLAWLSFRQVSGELLEQGSIDARRSAKAIGMDIFEHLNYLGKEMNVFAHKLRAGDSFPLDELRDESAMSSHPRLLALFTLQQDGSLTSLAGQVPYDGNKLILAIRKERDTGKLILLTVNGEQSGGERHVLILKRLEPERLDSTLLGARIDTSSLWDDEQLSSRSELICILSETNIPLYCNHPAPPAWLAQFSSQRLAGEERFFWRRGETDALLSAFWVIFLETHYQIREWTVAVGVPEAEAMAPVRDFRRIFLQVMLSTLILVTLFSVRAVRRSLHPLGQLLQATNRLARGQFDTRVGLTSGDEFQQLGSAFDQMARRLGRHFSQQHSITAISQQLQQCQQPMDALQVCIEALPKLVDAEQIGAICWRDSHRSHHFHGWPMRPVGVPGAETELVSTNWNDLPTATLYGDSEELLLRYPGLTGLHPAPKRQLVLVPAVSKGRTRALLLLILTQPLDVKSGRLALLNQIAELLSITLANIYLQQRFRHQAHHDSLTDLPNRLYLRHLVEKEIRSATEQQQALALMIVDIDRFKMVNDSIGHAAGDELLVQVSERLGHLMARQEILGRLGGDEFVIILPNLPAESTNAEVEAIINRFDLAFKRPFLLGNRRFSISASKGLTLFPRDGGDFLTLLKNADAAMYQAKHRKSGSSAFYSSVIQTSLEARAETEQELIQAVENEQFVLHYQPSLQMDGGRVVGAEALVRWLHPQKGLVMPGSFIEIAEDCGLIDAIGKWTLRQACHDFKQWRKQGFDLEFIAVNLSAQQLHNPHLSAEIKEILLISGMDPRHLELEVTETALIDDYEGAVAKLRELRQLGVHIAIDDFGTGYASLKHLKSLPADKLKIDRLFVKELPAGDRDLAIISSLVTLARQLNLVLLAEGIETRAQQQALLGQGVGFAQGYLFSKPLPLAEFLNFVHTAAETDLRTQNQPA